MSPPPLTRVCSSCGLEKPLSAFLHIGTAYGTICATCRGLGKTEKSRTSPDESEKSKGPSGHRIGAKEKVFTEKEQQRQIKDLKELYRQEIKKRDETADKNIKLTDLIERERKDHRQYIENKKQKQTFLGQKTPSQEKNIDRGVKEAHEAKVEHVKQEEYIRRELQIASWDMTGTFVDSNAALSKYKQGTFLDFKTWLGKSAALRTAERVYNALETSDKPAATKGTSAEKKALPHKEKDKELDDYIDKRNESSLKRRR